MGLKIKLPEKEVKTFVEFASESYNQRKLIVLVVLSLNKFIWTDQTEVFPD